MTKRIHFTREGIYYLFVLVFVIGGAVFREVNLLLVIAAMMIGPIVFSWRLAAATTTQLRIGRRVPPVVAAGSPFSVEIVVANRRKRLTTWALEVEDSIESESPIAETAPQTARVLLPCVPPGQTAEGKYVLRATRRGRLHLTELRAVTRFPWGFVAGRLIDRQIDTVCVTPRLGQLTPHWTQLIGARVSAAHHSDRRRSSTQRRGQTDGDYYGLRNWQAGDSRRWIHWRTSAKLGSMSVLQFEQRRNQDTALIVDLWQGDRENPSQTNLELAISFAGTAVSDVCRRGIGNLLAVVIGEEDGIWDRNATPLLAQEILVFLATVQGHSVPSSDRVSERIAGLMQAGTNVIVISTRPRVALVPGIECHWIDVGTAQAQDFFQLTG